MKKLSFIIVNWNTKELLGKNIESTLRETTRYPHEIIVVDNASSDGSPEFIRTRFPKVTLICNAENLGFAKANNIGLRKSTGDYLFLVNSDVELLEGCIDRMVSFLERRTDVGLAGPQIVGPDGAVQRSCMEFPTLWNIFCRALALDAVFPKMKLFAGRLMTYWAHDEIRNVDIINGCLWMVRREALTQVGPLDERFFIYAEDIDWCRRFWNEKWTVVYFPQARARHYGGASSAQAPIRFHIEMNRARLLYWKKYHGRPAQIGFLAITGLHHLIRLVGGWMAHLARPGKRDQTRVTIRKSLACIRWVAGFER